jgi:L-amino acid N-acyltransferase YncA
MSLHIRPTTPADLPAITAIYRHAVLTGTATFEIEPPDLAEMTRRYDALTSDGYPYLVATLDGAVAGYAYAGAYRARPAYRFSVENSIYLDPAAQGKRIGTQLMQALIAESEKRGYRLMVAVIGDSANAASIGVHSRAGFQMVGTLENVGLKFGRWLDTVLMQLPLGEGSATIPKS